MADRRLWMVLLLAAFGWGTGSVATRSLLLHGVDPFTLMPIRFVAAAAILVGWLWWRRRLTTDRGVWLAGLIVGTANMSAPTVFFTVALEHISAGLGGLLIALIPVVTTVWAHFVLVEERFTLRKLAGSGVAFAGVAVLIATGEAGFTGGSIIVGVAWSAVGILLASLGGVLSRVYAQRYPVMELAGPQFVACAVGVLIIWPLFGSTPLASITPTSWSLLAYMATLGTVLPYLGFLWVVRHTTATRASLVGYLVPLVSLAAGALLLAEQLNLIIGLAAGLILVGVVIVDRAEPTRPVEPHGV
ncbi:MAG: DMT family transporter [Acidimicrobiia bacterium]